MTTTHTTHSEDETQAVARELASRFGPGDVVLLSGNLGAGKTAFVRGLAIGLGVDPGDVSSPTFTLIHEYRGGRLVLYHADLYRLGRAASEDIGLEEAGARDGVLAIEWPERLTHPLSPLGNLDELDRGVVLDLRRRRKVDVDHRPRGQRRLYHDVPSDTPFRVLDVYFLEHLTAPAHIARLRGDACDQRMGLDGPGGLH